MSNLGGSHELRHFSIRSRSLAMHASQHRSALCVRVDLVAHDTRQNLLADSGVENVNADVDDALSNLRRLGE